MLLERTTSGTECSDQVLRLLIDTGNAPPRTGTGIYGQGLLAALRHYSSADVHVSESGTSLTGSSFRPLRRLGYLWRLRRLARGGFDGADVVHFINVYVPKKQWRTASVGTIHDLDAIQHPEVYARRYSAYYARTVQATVERADMVLTDTEAVRRMMMERYKLAEDRISAVGIGLNFLFVRAVDALSSSEAPAEPEVLFVGRLEKKKNIAWLVRTTAEGVKNGALPHLKLILAGGQGFGFGEISAAISDAGPLVEWVRDPDIQSLAALYRRASMVVLPSVCEGFGIPLLEAMYCGKPIAASKIPVSLEVAGDAARFFNVGNRDEFYAVMNDMLIHGNGDVQIRAAREKLRTYSWENLAPRYVAIYRRVKP